MLEPWLKALHIIAVISWMAGILYLPRLFIYHCDAPVGSPQSETFKVMERRLMKAIMTPAMIVTWVLGLWLATTIGYWEDGWLWLKLAAVVGITACHMYYAKALRAFADDANEKTTRHWRIMNEVPTVLMIVAVVAVVVRPFG